MQLKTNNVTFNSIEIRDNGNWKRS